MIVRKEIIFVRFFSSAFIKPKPDTQQGIS